MVSAHTFKTIYPLGKGPTYELYSSSRRATAVPLFKNYMQFFFGFFHFYSKDTLLKTWRHFGLRDYLAKLVYRKKINLQLICF